MRLFLVWLAVFAAHCCMNIACAETIKPDSVSHGIVDVITGKVRLALPSGVPDPLKIHSRTVLSDPADDRLLFDDPTDTYFLTHADGRTSRYQRISGLLDYRLVREDNPNGTRKCYEYDAQGRLTGICDRSTSGEVLAKFVWEYVERDPRVFTITDDKGRLFTYLLTEDGLMNAVTLPDGNAFRYVYDADRRLVRLEQPDGYFVTISYNTDGKVSQLMAPQGQDITPSTLATYTFKEDVTDVTDAEGKTVRFHHDEGHLCAKQELREGKSYRTIHYWWDAEGHLVGTAIVNDQHQAVWSQVFDYNSSGDVVTETVYGDLSGEGVSMFHVELGKPTDPYVESYRIYYAYDDLHRVIEKFQENGSFTRFGYFAQTSLVASQCMGDSTGIKLRYLFNYDMAGRLLETIVDDGNSQEGTDLAGVTQRRGVSVAYANGKPYLIDEKFFDPAVGDDVIKQSFLHVYNEKGHLVARHRLDGDGIRQQSTFYGHDVMGRVTSASDASNSIKQYRYDPMGRQTCQRDSSTGIGETSTFSLSGVRVGVDIVDSQKRRFHQGYRYDKVGRCVSSVDIYGNETQYSYDAMGRLVQTAYPAIVDSQGNAVKPVMQRSYDVLNRVVKITDPVGHVTEMRYNARGSIAQVNYPDGSSESFVYYLDGTLKDHTARNGVVTHYERDFLSRVTEKTVLTGEGHRLTTAATYSPFHLLSTTDPLGRTMRWQHDATGRMVSSILEWEEGSAVAKYSYDKDDNLTSIQHSFGDEDGMDLRMERNEQGQAVACQVVDHMERELISGGYFKPRGQLPPQVEEDYAYLNSLGQRVLQRKVTDERGITTATLHDALGHVVEETRTDAFGARLSLSQYFYDLAGHMVEERHGCTEPIVTRYQYGPMGQLSSKTHDSMTTHYFYDDAGQLSCIRKPDGVELTMSYDALGRVRHLASSDGSVEYSYTYDMANHPIEIVDHVANTVSKREYHPLGGIAKEESLVTVRKAFDGQGRTSSLTLPDGSAIEYDYDSVHLKAIHRVSQDGVRLYSHEYTRFSPLGQPIESKMVGAAGTIATLLDDSGGIQKISSESWSQSVYKDNGHVVGTRTWDSGGKHDISYAYDMLGQVVSERGYISAHYSYDSLGNRVEWQGHTYDANGNVVLRQGREGTQQMRYDALDRLVEVLQPEKLKVSFTYDAFNRRQSKTVLRWHEGTWISQGTLYFVYDGEQEIGAVDALGNLIELRVLGTGIQADIGATVAMELQGNVYATIHDSRGCVRCLVAADGSGVVESYRYGAFGEEQALDKAGRPIDLADRLSPWRFSSKRIDSELDLLFFGRRYYDPSLGRWLTPDPLGTIDGPNRYAFVRNDPLSFVDPQGLFSVEALWTSAKAYLGDYWNRLTTFPSSSWDLFQSNMGFMNDVMDDIHFVAYELVGPGLYLIAGLHNEDIEFGVCGRGEFSDKIRVSHINGVLNIRDGARESAEIISRTHGGINVHYLFRPSDGLTRDLMQGFLTVFGIFGYVSPSATRLAEGWRELIAEMGGVGKGGLIVHYAHSLGGGETANARRLLTPEEQKMIRVTTFGSAKVIPEEGFIKVHHYISAYDGVMVADAVGYLNAFMSRDPHVTFLEPHGYFGLDHLFTGVTYQKMLEVLGRRFAALYDPSQRRTVYLEPEER